MKIKNKKQKQIPLIFAPIFAGICRVIYVYYLILPNNPFKTLGFVWLETFLLTATPLWIIMLLNKRSRKVNKQTSEEKSSLDNIGEDGEEHE